VPYFVSVRLVVQDIQVASKNQVKIEVLIYFKAMKELFTPPLVEEYKTPQSDLERMASESSN